MSRYQHEEGTFWVDVLKIALGVFIGGLLAAFAFAKYIDWEMSRAVWQFDKAIGRETQRMRSEVDQFSQSQERTRQQQIAAEQIERDRAALQVRQRQIAKQQEVLAPIQN